MKLIIAVLVGNGAARSGEVRIERRRMLVDIVDVAAAGIRLPDFDERVGNRTLVLVEHVAVHDDAFAERLTFVLLGEVVVAFLHGVVAVNRSGQLGQSMRHDNQRLRRRALDRAAVARREMLGKSIQALFWKNQRHSCSLYAFASSRFLERERYALPDADAHGGKRKLAAVLLQAMHRRQRQPRARHAERMAERDRAAMRIDVRGVVGKPELPQAG